MRLAATAVVAVGLAFTAGTVAANTQTPTEPVPFTSIYDHDDIYWVFRHRDGLCDIAEHRLADGAQLGDAIERVVGDSGLTTRDGQMYLRGVLAACID